MGTLADLTRTRIDLLVENAMLRQQLIILTRQVNKLVLATFPIRPLFSEKEALFTKTD